MSKNFEIITANTPLEKGDSIFMWSMFPLTQFPLRIELAMVLKTSLGNTSSSPVEILRGKKIETTYKNNLIGCMKFNYNSDLYGKVFFLSNALEPSSRRLFYLMVGASSGIVESEITPDTQYIIVFSNADPLVKVFYGSEKEIITLSEARKTFFDL